MQTILLTRPAQGADRFAIQLRTRFGVEIRIVASPILTPHLLSVPRPVVPYNAVIFTSEAGVAGFRQLSAETGRDAWCVGDRTAAAAQAAGFRAKSAGGDVTALVSALQDAQIQGTLLYARGRDAAGNLANSLNSLGFTVVEAVVYEQQPTPLNGDAAALLAGIRPVIAPVFSPRSADLLASDPAMQGRRAPVWIAALSPAVAAASAGALAERTVCAARPDADAMLDAVAELIVTASLP